MPKKSLFKNIMAVLKYLVLAFIFIAGCSYYYLKLDQTEPGITGTRVITGSAKSVASQSKVVGEQALLSFQVANEAIQRGDVQIAENHLRRLISQYPQLPEPYTNLASLQAANGQLTEARATLLRGLNANKSFAVLFSNLQKIQGALAANAYQAALVDQGQAITSLNLPVSENIDLEHEPKEATNASPKIKANN